MTDAADLISRLRFVVRPRARRISLRIDPSRREALAILPHARYRRKAEKLALEKADWVRAHLEAFPPAMPFVDGGAVLIHGETYTLRRQSGRSAAQLDGNSFIIPCPDGALFAGRVRQALITLARGAINARVLAHVDAIARPMPKITLRDTSSRWGSCSAQGHLNFCWRLVCAPPFVLDYVCAHEVAHLVHHNHGAQFWDLVARLYGAPKTAKAWLRQNGARLYAIGAAQ